MAPLPQLRAPLAHLIDLPLDRLNPDADAASIGFELGFTGTAGADAAAETRQRRTGADQAREHVFELRQLHLPFALPRARAPRKDVEDQLRPVDDLPFQTVLELAQLSRRQLGVHDHQINVRLVARRGE